MKTVMRDDEGHDGPSKRSMGTRWCLSLATKLLVSNWRLELTAVCVDAAG